MELTISEKATLLKALEALPVKETHSYIWEDANGDQYKEEDIIVDKLLVHEEIDTKTLKDKIANITPTLPKV